MCPHFREGHDVTPMIVKRDLAVSLFEYKFCKDGKKVILKSLVTLMDPFLGLQLRVLKDELQNLICPDLGVYNTARIYRMFFYSTSSYNITTAVINYLILHSEGQGIF